MAAPDVGTPDMGQKPSFAKEENVNTSPKSSVGAGRKSPVNAVAEEKTADKIFGSFEDSLVHLERLTMLHGKTKGPHAASVVDLIQ